MKYEELANEYVKIANKLANKLYELEHKEKMRKSLQIIKHIGIVAKNEKYLKFVNIVANAYINENKNDLW